MEKFKDLSFYNIFTKVLENRDGSLQVIT